MPIVPGFLDLRYTENHDTAFSLLRSVFFAALFIWLQMWLLPRWVGVRGHWDAPTHEPLRWHPADHSTSTRRRPLGGHVGRADTGPKMPELPDVEAYRRFFREHAAGRTVRRVVVPDPTIVRNATPH